MTFFWFAIPKKCVYICFSIHFITDFGGFCNGDSAYICFGSANVLITVLFQVKFVYDAVIDLVLLQIVSILILDLA